MTEAQPAPPPPVHEAAARRDWPAYFDRIEGKPPRETLTAALDAFGNSAADRFAVDLGCGSGRDTALLLERGWRVLAVDGHADGIERTLARPECAAAGDRLAARVERFEAFELPRCDLVNASFALPFCPPAGFDRLWASVRDAIRPGGRFAGQLFGDRDSWAIIEDRTHLTRDQAIALFDGFVLERFMEEDRPSRHEGEAHKHWHVFHIVARRIDAHTESGS